MGHEDHMPPATHLNGRPDDARAIGEITRSEAGPNTTIPKAHDPCPTGAPKQRCGITAVALARWRPTSQIGRGGEAPKELHPAMPTRPAPEVSTSAYWANQGGGRLDKRCGRSRRQHRVHTKLELPNKRPTRANRTAIDAYIADERLNNTDTHRYDVCRHLPHTTPTSPRR